MTLGHPDDSDLDDATTTWMMWGTVLLFLVVVAFPVYRILEPDRRADAKEARSEQLALQGGDLYEVSCAQCHGPALEGGEGPAFNAKEFFQSATDEQMAQLIAVGIPGSRMSAYSQDFSGPLTSEQITAVVAYIRSFEEEAPSLPGWRLPLAALSEDATGQELYEFSCAQCHGTNLAGTDVYPDLRSGSNASEEPDSFLVRRIRDGRDEMPAFGDQFSDIQIDKIVSYLRGRPYEPPTPVPPTPEPSTTEPSTTEPSTTEPSATETPTEAPTPDPEVAERLAAGQLIFDVTAGDVGCASCHGFDARGTPDGPGIFGISRGAISDALSGGVREMEDMNITRDEMQLVYEYMQSLID